jgi:hypothetical protein
VGANRPPLDQSIPGRALRYFIFRQNFFFTMKKILLSAACLLLGMSSVLAQKNAAEKFGFVQGNVAVSDNDGVMLQVTKLTPDDAASLKALLQADPSAGNIIIVESDGMVRSYGSQKPSLVKFRGKTVSNSALMRGPKMTDNCSIIITRTCGSQADSAGTAFKASQLLRAYQQ